MVNYYIWLKKKYVDSVLLVLMVKLNYCFVIYYINYFYYKIKYIIYLIVKIGYVFKIVFKNMLNK